MRTAMVSLVAAMVLAFAAPAVAETAYTTGFGESAPGVASCQLFSLEVETGVAIPVGGSTPEYCAVALAQSPSGALFGVSADDQGAAVLVQIDKTTNVTTKIGDVGFSYPQDSPQFLAITFSPDGTLWLAANSGAAPCTDLGNSYCLYSVDPTTGVGTLHGGQTGVTVAGLAADCDHLYASGWPERASLSTVDTTTGALTTVGPLGASVTVQGMAADSQGKIWALDGQGPVFPFHTASVDPATGTATVAATITGIVNSIDAGGIALVPPTCQPLTPLTPVTSPPAAAPVAIQPAFTG